MSVPVRLDTIAVTLGGRRVLDGVSLDVGPGEYVTLLGESGSGKTTTLSVVAGLIQQDGGTVRIGDTTMEGLPPERRDIGMVFQSYALFPHLSVGENIAFPLRARRIGASERSDRIAEALRLVRLEGYAERSAGRLSGGEQQRVALARALVFRPRLLLLDEPLAALDESLRRTVRDELRRIHAEVGVTTIAVTHDQAEAMAMSDRVALLREGTIEQVGTPEELYHRPVSVAVATLLGEASLLPVHDGQVAALRLPVTARRGLAVLRPEALGIVEAGAIGTGALAGRVISVDFEGAHRRVVLAAEPSGERLVARIAAPGTGSSLRPGDQATVTCVAPRSVSVITDQMM